MSLWHKVTHACLYVTWLSCVTWLIYTWHDCCIHMCDMTSACCIHTWDLTQACEPTRPPVKHGSTLQHTPAPRPHWWHCCGSDVPQHTAAHYNTRQHTAIHTCASAMSMALPWLSRLLWSSGHASCRDTIRVRSNRSWCMFVYIHTHMYIYIYMCIHIHTYICIYTYNNIYAYI